MSDEQLKCHISVKGNPDDCCLNAVAWKVVGIPREVEYPAVYNEDTETIEVDLKPMFFCEEHKDLSLRELEKEGHVPISVQKIEEAEQWSQ
jgi:hypothetical protein